MKNHVKSDRHLALDEMLKSGSMSQEDAKRLRKANRIPRHADHWPTGDLIAGLLLAGFVFLLATAYFDVPIVDLRAVGRWVRSVVVFLVGMS